VTSPHPLEHKIVGNFYDALFTGKSKPVTLENLFSVVGSTADANTCELCLQELQPQAIYTQRGEPLFNQLEQRPISTTRALRIMFPGTAFTTC